MSIRSRFPSFLAGQRVALLLVPVLAALTVCSGCGRMRRFKPEKVYVSAREAYLRDRVAAVSNRTGKVLNGQPLQVLEHGNRFTQVKTAANQTGWIENHMVIDQKTYDAFLQLALQHRDDPVTAGATLNDDLYMHLTPGRSTDRFYLLPANTRVQLLQRASVPRAAAAGAASPLAALAQAPGPAGKKDTAQPPPPVPMEDWWLVRDTQGRTGWMLGSRLYVDVPDAIEQYGEGQDFIGAWKIATIDDPESDAPNHEVPEYLTVMAPPHSGLPFDFDQIRVFTWSRIHHRYETGFRLHPIRGYLPVRTFTAQTPKGPVPAFSFLLATSDNVTTDPDTGVVRPVAPRTIEYEVIDTVVRRIGADQAPIDTRHDEAQARAREKKKSHAQTRHR
ncbi:MAG: SH3 domain-containing protein [Acidobacteriota bacterium]